MVGLLAGLIGGLKAGLIAGVGTGLSMWLVFAVLVMTNFDSRKQSSPQELRRFDLAVSAGLGLLVGLLMGAALGLAFGLPAVVAALGLPSGALIGLALSASWTLWTGHLYLWTKYALRCGPCAFWRTRGHDICCGPSARSTSSGTPLCKTGLRFDNSGSRTSLS